MSGNTTQLLIYKIAPETLWHQAQEEGVFAGTAADAADGFIHFSFRLQIEETAAKWFSGQDHLMLIAADPARLGDRLRYEPSRAGALFPHLYGSLPLAAVVFARPLPLLPNGEHDFGAILGPKK